VVKQTVPVTFVMYATSIHSLYPDVYLSAFYHTATSVCKQQLNQTKK